MAQASVPLTTRAQRFPISVPLHYRSSGMKHWLEGKTVNISRTGILFQADAAIPASSVLDIQFDLEGATISLQGSVSGPKHPLSRSSFTATVSPTQTYNPHR